MPRRLLVALLLLAPSPAFAGAMFTGLGIPNLAPSFAVRSKISRSVP
jgi:hypothetical protein